MNSVLFYSVTAVVLLLLTGFYSLLLTKNLLRVLISIEILMKAVTFSIIVAGYMTGQTSLAQSLAITLIIVEVVAVAVASGIVLGIFRHFKTLDLRKIMNLKG